MKCLLLVLFAFIPLQAFCGEVEPPKPFKAWYLSFFAPDYMDVWLETVDVTDIQGNTVITAMKGTVSIHQPEDGSGEPAGWPDYVGAGAGVHLNRLDLPERIYVRWQSLAEPQTYRAELDFARPARDLMRKAEKVKCPITGWATDYRNAVTIGLAPGGIAKVWISGPCFKGTEVLRVQAEIEPKGPYQGLSEGRHRPLEPAAKAYIDKHGIPYDSW
ncbi:DUF2931 family protein [Pseudomonas sp. UBA2684]|uniref:DUF2931 family protein n=1 Tax=Pseudomonas sp. UBA2684 TaxID=1947311 RepID=UPI000E8C7335|nr:DUF2931 family protein [Pseudomonas sp. UBA2684]HBX55018.1 hypothetical protein [Pseudomonas sp.]|tara:strand:- start:296 stop:943 length:648 start_codon:yes stop_codon:yes gene_type:complete